jgi:hypothetical protein
MSLLLVMLAALPDLQALGQVDGALTRPAKNNGLEHVVELSLPGCDHEVPLNTTRIVAGTAFAMQQMLEWMRANVPQGMPPQAVLDEVSAGVREGQFADSKACKALPRDVTSAPKLCAGAAKDHAWLVANGKPAALVRWSAASGANKCAPKVTAVLFDAKGAARIRYDADFGGNAGGALLADKCQVTFTWDAAREVFHPSLRGCKGP